MNHFVSDSSIQRMQYYPSGLPWKDCYRADEQTIKYNGKEFVEMHGLDEYDSKARWYYPAIMRAAAMDPLCEKYYDTSPYVWCGNNPVNYVDLDGRDSKISVHDGIITISAKYYCREADYPSAKQATNFWNNQKELTYTTSEGKEYSVQFVLTPVIVNSNPYNDCALDESGKANSYSIVPKIENVSNFGPMYFITGTTENDKTCKVLNSYAETSTGAHEIGHTLMKMENVEQEHSETGIMTKEHSDPNRNQPINQSTINSIVESNIKNQTLWDKIVNYFGW